ncbi:unnamed protein product [Amoebophrya sp. A25]|nr:unnamed protein product [Amoebophrya sp. A25]|eukprot:GSA25T00003543001.1
MRYKEESKVYDSPWEEVTAAFWRKYPNEHASNVKSVDPIAREVLVVERGGCNFTSGGSSSSSSSVLSDVETASTYSAASSFGSSSASTSSTSSSPASDLDLALARVSSTTSTCSSISPSSSTTPLQQIESAAQFRVRRIMALEYPLPQWIERVFGQKMHGLALEEATVDLPSKTLELRSRNLGLLRFLNTEEVCVYRPDPENPNRTLSRRRSFSSWRRVLRSPKCHGKHATRQSEGESQSWI